ncbi:MAG: hypothetical protein N3D81_07880 [Spirochaetes bacterium]|nr:hypothetical protein [Spirochaetota bacterium]
MRLKRLGSVNDDGAGVAFFENGERSITKGIMDINDLLTKPKKA